MTAFDQATPTQIRLQRERVERAKRLGLVPLPKPRWQPPPVQPAPPKPVQPTPFRKKFSLPPPPPGLTYTARKAIGVSTIILVRRVVARYFNIDSAVIAHPSRKPCHTIPRHISMYLCRELLPAAPLTQIARFHGRTDHTTVCNAYKNICDIVQSGGPMAESIALIRKLVEDDPDVQARIQSQNKAPDLATPKWHLSEVWTASCQSAV